MEKKQNKKRYEIPVKGSLGLLAAGYKGIMVWRMKKMGLENSELKIIPPIVFGKVLSISKPKEQPKQKKEDE
jgi:hypothetical protein